MRNIALGLLASLFAVCIIGLDGAATAQTSTVETRRRAVLVELFTSEGCSSCPPADLLLQKLEAQQPIPGAEVIGLEEHVDYWNHDGWIDPFSSAQWTQRQQSYASLIKQDSYTPELVVDGRSQFVGNNPQQAETEIDKAAHEVTTDVSITRSNADAKNSKQFSVTIGKIAGNLDGDTAEVWLAVTEDGLHSSVSLGENAGHVLHHVATLRSLQKIGVADAAAASASFNGTPMVKINSHWNPDNVHVVVFVQKKKSREILGAASTGMKD